jgi:hypothetical protein
MEEKKPGKFTICLVIEAIDGKLMTGKSVSQSFPAKYVRTIKSFEAARSKFLAPTSLCCHVT